MHDALVANPDEPILLNNKTVALVRLKRYSDADVAAKRLRSNLNTTEPEPTTLATLGLLDFSKGNVSGGRNCYAMAAEKARKLGLPDLEFRVRAHWLYEEANAGVLSQDIFAQIVALMDDAASKAWIRPTSVETWNALKARASISNFVAHADTTSQIPFLLFDK
jgi:hypothetical protein